MDGSSQHSTYSTAPDLQDQVMPRNSASNAGDLMSRIGSPPGSQRLLTPAVTPRARSTPRTVDS